MEDKDKFWWPYYVLGQENEEVEYWDLQSIGSGQM